MATVETAKESERGIVDMETLKATNESLISTLDEVMRIQTEGHQKRMEAEKELGRIEGELKKQAAGTETIKQQKKTCIGLPVSGRPIFCFILWF